MKTTKLNQKSKFAENLIRLRKARGYRAAEEFADFAKIPYPTIRDIETGRSDGRPDTRQKIAEALKVERWEMEVDLDKIRSEMRSEIESRPTTADVFELLLAYEMAEPDVRQQVRKTLGIEPGNHIRDSFERLREHLSLREDQSQRPKK